MTGMEKCGYLVSKWPDNGGFYHLNLPQTWRRWAWRWSQWAAAFPSGWGPWTGSGPSSLLPGKGSHGTAQNSPLKKNKKQKNKSTQPTTVCFLLWLRSVVVCNLIKFIRKSAEHWNSPALQPASQSRRLSSPGWGWAACSCSHRGWTFPTDDSKFYVNLSSWKWSSIKEVTSNFLLRSLLLFLSVLTSLSLR